MPDNFAPAPAATVAVPSSTLAKSATALLDAEKLLRDQLDRASVSIALNIAEGAGRFSPPDKARFYAIARGSATECGAVVDLLLARGLVAGPRHREARILIVRIVQMLTRLIARMSTQGLLG